MREGGLGSGMSKINTPGERMGSVKWGTDSLQDESRGRKDASLQPSYTKCQICMPRQAGCSVSFRLHLPSPFPKFHGSEQGGKPPPPIRLSEPLHPLPPPNDCDRSFGTRTHRAPLSLSLSLNAPLHSLLPPSLSDFEARLRFALAE